jgi:hypothetical protein
MEFKPNYYKYRIIEESDLTGDPPVYFIQVYKKDPFSMFGKKKWVWIVDKHRAREFSTLEDAKQHVKKLCKRVTTVYEGTIERDEIDY